MIQFCTCISVTPCIRAFGGWQKVYHQISCILFVSKTISTCMTSLRYDRIFCLESQKIDGTEYIYLRGSTDFAIFFILLYLEA